MRPEELLDYEIALLLAKHGENRVLGTLAAKLKLSPEQLERKLAELNNRGTPTKSTRKPIDATAAVESIAAEQPEKASHLRLLLDRFQNKTFLPELKDVRRFFDLHSAGLGSVKSRAEAVPRLFKLLGSLDESELAGLSEGERPEDRSSLGIISDAIMRRS